MKKLRLLLFFLLIILLFGGCKFLGNTYTYRNLTREFLDDLLHKDYDKCIALMATDNYANANRDTLKRGLDNFRSLIVSNLGEKLDYTFMQSTKSYSIDGGKNTTSDTTVVLMQLSNDKKFAVLKVFFDDGYKKVQNMNFLDGIDPIPDMTVFWLFGILPLSVFAFNIYIIVKVKRSNFKRKWLKYFAIILLNVPAITYNPVAGFSYGLLDFQILLGMSFSYMGYLSCAWTFGFPLGGLYIFGNCLPEKIK